jgi:DNA topoisomerase I
MQDNLVIVESPAKAKTIEKFLGKDYKVMSSYGHIRDLKKKELSVGKDTLTPEYEIPDDKKKVVAELKKSAKAAKKVWLASDEDREGEAISWHLCEVLGLDEAKTSRIVFHEITKPAILKAIANPRHLDMSLVDAQQARRVLDRIVGFKLSPVLWRKVKPALSAGRVQSVAVKLIVEREREIQKFESEPFFRVNALFCVAGNGNEVKAELDHRFKTYDEAHAFLESCKDATFVVGDITKKPLKRMPAPPFTTSTLQQEAARKLGFTVSQTMMIAQRLYESGRITYMRTDSVHLSSFALNACKEEIMKDYGEEYVRNREFQTKSKGAQEAHEAIRPTFASTDHGEMTLQERRLYDLIWKRTIASQMAEAMIEKTTAVVNIDNRTEHFVANGEVVVFDGFLKVYRESTDEETIEKSDGVNNLPAMKAGDSLDRKNIVATERFTQAPARYTEASLVHKLEELGIGRPSTYAPTISTIQQREYVVKGDKPGKERPYTVDTLEDDTVTQEKKVEFAGSERGKLIPTDIGTVVNDFLQANFPEIMDYNFTAKVEGDFDRIAEGKEDWKDMLHKFDDGFEPQVEKVINQRSEHKAGERQIGTDPKSGKPVFVKIGRFGPVVQIGAAGGEEKPLFAQMPKDKSIETITLEEALELFKLPRKVGKYEGLDVTIGAGRFGPYVLHNKQYVSIPKGEDPMAITLERSIELIEAKRKAEKERHIKTFAEDAKMELLKGRFGPYIAYDGKNYHIDKKLHERALAGDLSFDECMDLVKNAPEPKPRRGRKS